MKKQKFLILLGFFNIKALENDYDSLETAKKLFEFDLRHSPWKVASQSYQQLRKLGLKADPFSFYRLRLFFKYPLHLLSWNSIPGFLMLLIACIIIFSVPYIWLLPLHYLGHWLCRKKEPKKTLFSIRHLWLANAAMLLSWFIAVGLFQFDELTGLITDRSMSSSPDDTSNAMFLIVFCLLMTISSLVLIFRLKRWELLKPQASIGKTIGLLITSIFLLYIVRKINFHFFPELISENVRNISTGSIVVIIKSMLLTRGFFLTMIIVCVLVPFYEEFIFRGIGIEALNKYFPFWVANLVQAASFALLHDSIQLFPTFFSMGLLFGLLYKNTQSLFLSVLFHSLNNLVATWGIWAVMQRHGL